MAKKNEDKEAAGFDIRAARRFDRLQDGDPSFSIDRKRILQSVKLAGQFIENATTGVAEKYQSVLVEAVKVDDEHGVVRLTTKSSSSAASIAVACNVESAGVTFVRHESLVKALSTIKADAVSITSTPDEVQIEGAGKKRSAQSVVLPVVRVNNESELPDFDISGVDDSGWLHVSHEALLGAVKVLPKPNQDRRSSIFSGLVFASKDGLLEVLSTNGDSYSSLAQIECDGADMPVASLLYQQVNEVLSDIEPENSGIYIGEVNNKVVFSTDSGVFSMPSVGNIGASSGDLGASHRNNADRLVSFGEMSSNRTFFVDGKKMRSAINAAQDLAKIGGVINRDMVQVKVELKGDEVVVSTEDSKTYVEEVDADVETDAADLPAPMFVIPSIYPESINAMTMLSHDGEDSRVRLQVICLPSRDGGEVPQGIFITGVTNGATVKKMIGVRS